MLRTCKWNTCNNVPVEVTLLSDQKVCKLCLVHSTAWTQHVCHVTYWSQHLCHVTHWSHSDWMPSSHSEAVQPTWWPNKWQHFVWLMASLTYFACRQPICMTCTYNFWHNSAAFCHIHFHQFKPMFHMSTFTCTLHSITRCH